MLKICVKIFWLGLLALISAAPLMAWDDTGHKLTAYIAWQRMTPAARENVIKILLAAPENSDLSVYYLQDSRSEAVKQRELFMIAATWADIVRDKKFPIRYKEYHHGNWHYTDTFWRETNGKPELLDEKEEGGKAVDKLTEFDKTLRDSSASNADKAIAIAWILHLGGDIHQPLHASARITDLEPKGDQGGNTFLLTPKDAAKTENLHWFWDSIVGRNVPRKNDACDSDYLPPLADEMMKKFPFAKMQSNLKPGQFDEWRKESWLLATTEVFSPDLKRFEMPSEKYQKKAYRVAQERLALAGYRLGEMMNQIFGAPKVASNAAPKSSAKICYVIKHVDYPVSQTRSADQKQEIGLLDLCPANPGQVARPMYPIFENGSPVMYEYDVERIFKTAVEAGTYAADHKIKDVYIN